MYMNLEPFSIISMNTVWGRVESLEGGVEDIPTHTHTHTCPCM